MKPRNHGTVHADDLRELTVEFLEKGLVDSESAPTVRQLYEDDRVSEAFGLVLLSRKNPEVARRALHEY